MTESISSALRHIRPLYELLLDQDVHELKIMTNGNVAVRRRSQMKHNNIKIDRAQVARLGEAIDASTKETHGVAEEGPYRWIKLSSLMSKEGASIFGIRVRPPRVTTSELVREGFISRRDVRLLEQTLKDKRGVIIIGPPATGKTRLMTSLVGRLRALDGHIMILEGRFDLDTDGLEVSSLRRRQLPQADLAREAFEDLILLADIIIADDISCQQDWNWLYPKRRSRRSQGRLLSLSASSLSDALKKLQSFANAENDDAPESLTEALNIQLVVICKQREDGSLNVDRVVTMSDPPVTAKQPSAVPINPQPPADPLPPLQTKESPSPVPTPSVVKGAELAQESPKPRKLKDSKTPQAEKSDSKKHDAVEDASSTPKPEIDSADGAKSKPAPRHLPRARNINLPIERLRKNPKTSGPKTTSTTETPSREAFALDSKDKNKAALGDGQVSPLPSQMPKEPLNLTNEAASPSRPPPPDAPLVDVAAQASQTPGSTRPARSLSRNARRVISRVQNKKPEPNADLSVSNPNKPVDEQPTQPHQSSSGQPSFTDSSKNLRHQNSPTASTPSSSSRTIEHPSPFPHPTKQLQKDNDSQRAAAWNERRNVYSNQSTTEKTRSALPPMPPRRDNNFSDDDMVTNTFNPERTFEMSKDHLAKEKPRKSKPRYKSPENDD